MILRSHVCDCLVLNGVVPQASLPPPPAPLRYEVHPSGGVDWVFVSSLLFRHVGVNSPRAPWLRLSHPQMNVRLYVLDEDGVPSVLFRRMFVPYWAAPALRFVVGTVARGAMLSLPSTSLVDEACWRVRGDGRLVVTTRLGSVPDGAGPRLGSFERTVEILQDRPRGYALGARGLHRLGASHPRVNAVPVAAELRDASLFERLFPGGAPSLHSSWIAPETPFEFEFHPLTRESLPTALPQPAASRGVL